MRSWVFPFFGLTLLLMLALLPLGRGSSEDKIVRARSKAEVLAYQVAQLYRESLIAPPSDGSRSPASVQAQTGFAPAEGLMGQDPWGQAYTYKIEPAADGRLRVEMRSPGPNGRADVENGDDVLLVLSL